MTLSEVYDIECLYNCFTYTGLRRNTGEIYQFVIHDSRNDLNELINHLLSEKFIMIGFNNENFDYPIIHHIINHKEEYLNLSADEVSRRIYKKAQEIIGMDFSAIADKHKYIQQIDLYLIWGYNNKARSTSLKALEIAMNMEIVEDMPIEHTSYVHKQSIPLILEYNLNDVLATNQFLEVTLGNTEYSLYKGKDKIKLRQELSKKFGLNVINFPDIKIGEQLLLHLYSNATNTKPWDLKKNNTVRDKINLGDCLPSWCKFKTKEFNNLVNEFKNKTLITSLGKKDDFSLSVIYHNHKFDYGVGGMHGCIKPGVYSVIDDPNYMIIDADIGSLYPSIAKSFQIYPEHLGKEYINIYSSFIDRRLAEKSKSKEERDYTLIEGYKLLLNSVYGKSGEDNSFLYDRLYQLKTTIAGQIFISMWCERIVEICNEVIFLQENTDGITIKIPKSSYNDIIKVGDELTNLTGLTIEYNEYTKMVIRDVNNYAAQYKDDPEHIKYKGCFEIDKEYHKDPSMRIVPLALKNYFFNDIPVADTINNHKNIYDFCLRLKLNSTSEGYLKYIKNGEFVKENLTKTTRYYISNKGGILLKHFKTSNKYSGVNIGYTATLFNRYVKKDNYDINYSFYINETNKIITAVDDRQLELF
jgi:hypothetical protein